MLDLSDQLELFLFHKDSETTRDCIYAGINGIIIDLENKGKLVRQKSYNTEINSHSISTISAVKHLKGSYVICRVNGFPYYTAEEINQVVEAGVDEILLPMVTSASDVERAFAEIDGRCKFGILVETQSAVDHIRDLIQFPLERIYIGLNDLSISRGGRNIFEPFIDGTIERLREIITAPLGVAGLTHPMRGEPISCQFLLREMCRLKMNFTFLRRSFYRDLKDFTPLEIISTIHEETRRYKKDSAHCLDENFTLLKKSIASFECFIP